MLSSGFGAMQALIEYGPASLQFMLTDAKDLMIAFNGDRAHHLAWFSLNQWAVPTNMYRQVRTICNGAIHHQVTSTAIRSWGSSV